MFEFFDTFNIKPKYYHGDCNYYEDVYGHEICMNKNTGKLSNQCDFVKKIYPQITFERILNLIALASGYFQVTFSFERGISDIQEGILTMLTNFQKEHKLEELETQVKRIFK